MSPVSIALGASLFISGGRLTDELKQEFLALAGSRLVVITTASPWADTDHMETEFDSGIILHTRSRLVANSPEFVKPLKEATAVWFEGGDQNWLTDTYLDTLTEREIWGVLERGGIVGGTSAGAAIMSPVMLPRLGRGLGFLPNTIVDQHFTERGRQQRLLSAISGTDLLGLGIDEGTVLLIQGHEAKILGEGRVHVYKSFKSGDAFKW